MLFYRVPNKRQILDTHNLFLISTSLKHTYHFYFSSLQWSNKIIIISAATHFCIDNIEKLLLSIEYLKIKSNTRNPQFSFIFNIFFTAQSGQINLKLFWRSRIFSLKILSNHLKYRVSKITQILDNQNLFIYQHQRAFSGQTQVV